MGNNCFEVFDANANVKLLLDSKVFEIEVVYGDRCLQWLFQHICAPSVNSSFRARGMIQTLTVHDLLRVACKRSTSVLSRDV